jgi:hypothetical protein
MKKITCILLFTLTYLSALSQQVETGFYSSYSYSIQNSFIGLKQNTINGNLFSISTIRGSLASGFNYGFFSNVKVHENVKLTFAYNFLRGSNVLFSSIEEGDLIYKLNGKAKQEVFSPGFIFHFPTKKLVFFSKNSLMIPIKTQSEFIQNERDFLGQELFKEIKVLDYSFNFGFKNAIGSEITLTKSIKIALSIESTILNLKSKSSETIYFAENGHETTSSLKTYDKNTNYFDNLNNFSNNENYNNLYDLNKNRDELSFSHNFSNFETKVSFVYVFQQKNEKK